MNCPRCKAALQKELAEGVELDRCPTCHGMWLDMLELEQLVREVPAALLADDRRFHASPHVAGERLECPNCRGAQLIKLNSRLRPGTIIDSCQVCYGNWLDAGELSRLTGHDLRTGLLAVFRG
ncbi:MAG: zf-TFIIB domain-containing protein [Phycisphaerae bacterium]